MPFDIILTPSADKSIELLSKTDTKKHRKILKTLGLLSVDPKYPGLNSHKMESQRAPNGGDVWESYVENRTPGAYRVFWFYGPESRKITVFAITPHP